MYQVILKSVSPIWFVLGTLAFSPVCNAQQNGDGRPPDLPSPEEVLERVGQFVERTADHGIAASDRIADHTVAAIERILESDRPGRARRVAKRGRRVIVRTCQRHKDRIRSACRGAVRVIEHLGGDEALLAELRQKCEDESTRLVDGCHVALQLIRDALPEPEDGGEK